MYTCIRTYAPPLHGHPAQDKARTEAYRDFMLNNKALFEGKTVLDVGTELCVCV
jgi:hypothetical protein